MTVEELIESKKFSVINKASNTNKEISKPYTCDLLSIAMGKMPERAAWVTVMGNINTLAVSALADASCIILAEGCALDEVAKMKAKEQDITVLSYDGPIFEGALIIYNMLVANE
ncbi:MAG TPA: hypothetical protein GXZ90_04225 [Clostridiales bacterium]|nr:hypothetical protein [Clostridiales bacterium]